ncbi:hypothetical protein ACFQE1_00515 [Halobium palmae]|uniref:Uncharacterized protein n=1 Tax=Halobium palmae TaxID=1776492 RepID=A0ABD5RUG2_9EURY
MRLIKRTNSVLVSLRLVRSVRKVSDPERRQMNPPMRKLRLVNTGSEKLITGNGGE